MTNVNRWVLALLLISLLHFRATAAVREFSVPLSFLKTAAAAVQVTLDVTISGHSPIHKLEADCEMHFGAHSTEFTGDPDGLVLEPMNLCVEDPPPALGTWKKYADSLANKKVTAVGVPRIWPEHLVSSNEASNPSHAVELHPVTSFKDAAHGNQSFASFIYDAEGFEGGLGEATAGKILTKTTVSVTESAGNVKILFNSGTIGNFSIVQVKIDEVVKADGGHKLDGDVTIGDADQLPIRMVTVAGSAIDKQVESLKGKTFEALVLFSLDPEALFEAAQKSHGAAIKVKSPLQLILFGESQD